MKRSRAVRSHGTIVLQGTGVANAFVTKALPLLNNAGLALNVYIVTSTELFDMLPPSERERIFPEAHQQDAMASLISRWRR